VHVGQVRVGLVGGGAGLVGDLLPLEPGLGHFVIALGLARLAVVCDVEPFTQEDFQGVQGFLDMGWTVDGVVVADVPPRTMMRVLKRAMNF
jgi:hypothetical protein